MYPRTHSERRAERRTGPKRGEAVLAWCFPGEGARQVRGNGTLPSRVPGKREAGRAGGGPAAARGGLQGKRKGPAPLAGDLGDAPSLIWTMEVKPSLPLRRPHRAGQSVHLFPEGQTSLTEALSLPAIVLVIPPSGAGFYLHLSEAATEAPQPETCQGARTPAQGGPVRGVPWGLSLP